MDEVMQKLAHDILNGTEPEKTKEEELAELLAERYRKKRMEAQVFCVACRAKNRTLRKWHNSYLCEDCYKIAKNVGDEKFIKALKGETSE